jgi:phenylpropionate dioxygenase-like ring-hydroxylating dioxygenase large terminal subunit
VLGDLFNISKTGRDRDRAISLIRGAVGLLPFNRGLHAEPTSPIEWELYMKNVIRFRETGPAPADSFGPPALPYPNGWFCLAFSDELKPGSILTRPLLGEEVVLYKTQRGRIRAIRPYCPHLGAHLGAGGKISGEDIVCPFHKFAFDPAGTCVRTGYGLQPPRASLIQYPVSEVNGSVYVWRHSLGAPPDWEVPALYTPGRVAPSHHTFEMAGHPQDVTENVFDFGHFTHVHGATDVTVEGEPVLGEKICVLQSSVQWPSLLLGKLRMDTTHTVIGLATLLLEISLPQAKTSMYVITHCTPIKPGRVQFRVGTVIDLKHLPLLRGAAGRRVARHLSQLLTVLAQRQVCQDASLDVSIWHHQRHCEHPRLAQGDGPIGRYRQWVRQFYTEPTASAADAGTPRDPGMSASDSSALAE